MGRRNREKIINDGSGGIGLTHVLNWFSLRLCVFARERAVFVFFKNNLTPSLGDVYYLSNGLIDRIELTIQGVRMALMPWLSQQAN